MERIVVELICSKCEGTEDVVTYTIAVQDAAPREIELCVQCTGTILAPLERLLSIEGRPVEPKGDRPKARSRATPGTTWPCRTCPRTFPSKQGRTRHESMVHSQSASSLVEA